MCTAIMKTIECLVCLMQAHAQLADIVQCGADLGVVHCDLLQSLHRIHMSACPLLIQAGVGELTCLLMCSTLGAKTPVHQHTDASQGPMRMAQGRTQ